MQRTLSISAMIAGLASAASLIAGCASVDTQTAEPREDKTYMTGSRIAVRDGSTSNSVKSVINNRDVAESIDERRRIYLPPAGGPK